MTLAPIDDLATLAADWHRIEGVAAGSFFTSWLWLGTLLATLPRAARPELLRVTAGRETVALAVLTRRSVRRHWAVAAKGLWLNSTGQAEHDCIAIEHNDLLAVPDKRRAAGAALLDWFSSGRAPGDELVLPGWTRSPDRASIEARGLLRDERAVRSFHVDLRQVAERGGSLAPLVSANARSQLRRALRAYGGAEAPSIAEAAGVEEALAWFSALKALHVASWTRRGKPHSFHHPFFEEFHHALIARAFACGAIQLLRVAANGRAIGYLYNFRHGHSIHAYQSGFADDDGRLRPGAVSHALAIEFNCRQGARLYDFMAGPNRLKESFATGETLMYWTSIRQPLVKYRFEQFGARVKSLLRGHRRGGAAV